MKIFKPSTKDSHDINITPLMDIIFILLIFFMVSTSFLKPAIQVKLPVAAHEETSPPTKVFVSMTADQTLYWDKRIISLNELQTLAYDQLQTNPDLVIMLSCDRSLIFEHVMQVIDVLKMTGVKNVAISHTST
ncbi:MAG: ExbD/TolR family protein [Brevinema sp.]